MSSSSNPTRSRHRRALLGTLFFVLAAWPAAPSIAAGNSGAWRPAPEFELRVVSHYQYANGRSTSHPALGAHLGLDLSPPGQPLAAGLFADYERAVSAGQTGTRLAGGWARYRFGRWELSSAGVNVASGHSDGQWMYLGRLQFEPRPGHKIGVEAIGSLAGGNNPALQFVYKTDLGRRMSLLINVGLGPNRLQDFGASSTFTWSLR